MPEIMKLDGSPLVDELTVEEEDPNLAAAKRILYRSCLAPIEQLFANADKNYIQEYEKKYDSGFNKTDFHLGVNLLTGEYGNLVEMGVIDPKKVTRKALENAVSVAATILTTNAIGTLQRVQV